MKIKKRGEFIYFNKKAYDVLKNYLLHKVDSIKNIFILVDDITHAHCLPILFQNINFLKKSNVIKIKSGEEEKNINTCIQICKNLEKFKATRKSLIINLGGGVITDIGGFVASIFKRGIRFINIPTTLLGMVDAAIGYKTGVNLNYIKNEIGSFYIPEFLIIDTHFLRTLPNKEIVSGMAEMLKHGLIASQNFWEQMIQIQTDIMIQNENKWMNLIHQSILIKQNIVNQDPKEEGLRKILNFGHTIGHALESYFMNINKILHGIAVIMGMIYESWISCKINGLSISDYKEIKSILSTLCPIENKISGLEIKKLLFIMEHDKKNEKNKIQFSLLKEIGKCSYNCQVPSSLIKESFLN
ncbi:3-dehydroquinate synthase [Blattabacterium sp. (Blaberus giganteus)]|uniref:3-dehydroquinate synthase n=1 Tax=Blattabacterium sp. (Blaberus giganteus) TaxID=1186051 RepID=UPI00025F6E84|nr:3-dehydroquinate synthase [Blattabacterium sp. (Blaberus giganteus)]AFJ90594.1 3-dehydroquinate synthase [Blattabacterium sp. (Blaberus giganteus)]